MPGRRSGGQRVVLSEQLVVPAHLLQSTNERAISFKQAINASIHNAALNPDIAVKTAFASGAMDKDDTDGRKREFSADARPGVVSTPEGWRYEQSKTYEDGDILALFPTSQSKYSISTEPNFGWMSPDKVGDPFKNEPFDQVLKQVASKPQVQLTKYKINPKTDDVDQSSAVEIDPFSIPSGMSLEQRRRIQEDARQGKPEQETKVLGRSIGSRVPGGTLLARAAALVGVVLDERNKFRCPPGTPAANQFTDRFGSTCFGFSSSRFARYALRAARELMPEDEQRSGKVAKGIRGFFGFLRTGEAKWLEEPGKFGRTVYYDAVTGERHEPPNWRNADIPGERKWMKGAFVRAQDEIKQIKAEVAALGAQLGVDQSDAARATNEDVFAIFDRLRETGQLDIQIVGPNNGRRMTPQEVQQFVLTRLSRTPNWNSLSAKEKELLIKQDVARYYESERGFLEAIISEHIHRPESVKDLKIIKYDMSTNNEAGTYTYRDKKSGKFHPYITVNFDNIMSNQETMLPNLAPDERLAIAASGARGDAQSQAAVSDFLMNANHAARTHAGLVDGAYSFASHIGLHEMTHVYQIEAVMKHIQRQLAAKGKIEIPRWDKDGQYIGKTVTDIRQLSNQDLWDIMKGQVRDVDVAAMNDVLNNTRIVSWLAGSYPKQFEGEPTVQLLEIGAELFALRERGFFAGEDLEMVNKALSWIDESIYADAADKARADADAASARQAAEQFKPDDGTGVIEPLTVDEMKVNFDAEKKETITYQKGILDEAKQRLETMSEPEMRDMAALLDHEIAGLEDQLRSMQERISGIPEGEDTVESLKLKQDAERLLMEREFRIRLLDQNYKAWRDRYTVGGARTRDRFYSNIDQDQKRLGLKRRKRKGRSSDSDYKDPDGGETEGSASPTIDFEVESARVQHKVRDYTPERLKKLVVRRVKERAAITDKESDEYLRINNEIETLVDEFVAKTKDAGDRRSKSRIRKEFMDEVDTATRPKPKKIRRFKSKADRSEFASKSRSKASRKRTADQKNAVEQLGAFDDARILEMTDPEKQVDAGTQIGTAHSRAKGGTMTDANPKSIHEASLEDQVKNILIPVMEEIDESSVEEPFIIETVMELDSSAVSGRVVGREIERRGFTTGTMMVGDKTELEKPTTSRTERGSGKTKKRVVILVKEGNRGIFAKKQRDEKSPTFVLPPGRIQIVGKGEDGTLYAEIVHQQDTVEAVGSMVSSLGDTEVRDGDNVSWRRGAHKKVKNVFDNYMNERRASGREPVGPVSTDGPEIERTGRDAVDEVTESGGTFGVAPDDIEAPDVTPESAARERAEAERITEERRKSYAAQLGGAIGERFMSSIDLDKLTPDQLTELGTLFNNFERLFAQVADLMETVDGQVRLEKLFGAQREQAFNLIREYFAALNALTGASTMRGFKPDPKVAISNGILRSYLAGATGAKSLEFAGGITTKASPEFFSRKPTSLAINTQDLITSKNSTKKTRSERKKARNEQAAKTINEIKKILGGGSSREFPGMTRTDIDKRITNMILEEPIEVLIARMEKAAMRMHFGFDRRVRVRTTREELKRLAENGGIRYSHSADEPITSRRLERLSRMAPENRDNRDLSFFARSTAKRAETMLANSDLNNAVTLAERLLDRNVIIDDLSQDELNQEFDREVIRTPNQQGEKASYQTANKTVALTLMILGYKVLFGGQVTKSERQFELEEMVDDIEGGAARDIKNKNPEWTSFIEGKIDMDDEGNIARDEKRKEIALRNEYSQKYVIDPCAYQFSNEAINPTCLEGVSMDYSSMPQLVGNPVDEKSIAARMLKNGLVDARWVSVFKKKLDELKADGYDELKLDNTVDAAISESYRQKMEKLRQNDNRYMAHAARHQSKSMPSREELRMMVEELKDKVDRLQNRRDRLSKIDDTEQEELDEIDRQIFEATNDYSIAQQAQMGPLSEQEKEWFYKNTSWRDVEIDLQENFAQFVKLVNGSQSIEGAVPRINPIKVDPNSLVANQKQIKAEKVKEMANDIVRDVTIMLDEMQDRGLYPRTEQFDEELDRNLKILRQSYPITIAAESSIIDGHHSWAAVLLANRLLGERLSLPVYAYNTSDDVLQSIALAKIFQDEVGLTQSMSGSNKIRWSNDAVYPITASEYDSWVKSLATRASGMAEDLVSGGDFIQIGGIGLSLGGRDRHGEAANRVASVKKHLYEKMNRATTQQEFSTGRSNVSTKRNSMRRSARDAAQIVRAGEKVVSAAIRKANLNPDISESIKYAIFFAATYEQGSPLGALSSVASDTARKSDLAVSRAMLDELVRTNKITSQQRSTIMSQLDSGGMKSDKEIADRVKNAFSEANDALRASMKNERDLDNSIPVEYLIMPRHIVGQNKIQDVMTKETSADPDEDGRNGKTVGKMVDVLARNNFERIGIPRHLPDDRLPITGYIVHKSHVNKRMADNASAAEGAISPIAVFEMSDQDNVGDGLTVYGNIELIIKRPVSRRVSYSRGNSMTIGSMPVLLNSSNRDDIADAYFGATGKNSKWANLEAMLGLLLAEATNNYSHVNTGLNPGSDNQDKRVFEALVLGGIDKDEVDQVNYPYSDILERAGSEDITKIIPDREIDQRLMMIGMTPENIEYIRSLPSSKMQTQAMDEIRTYMAGKKMLADLKKMGFDNVKIAHPKGFDIMDPRSYSRGARPSDDVLKTLKEKAINEISELSKRLIGEANVSQTPQMIQGPQQPMNMGASV